MKIMAILLSIAMLTSCAYSPLATSPLRTKDFYENRQEKDSITLVCLPYSTSGASSMVFGTDLLSAGIIPLEIILFNDSNKEYDLSKISVRLSDSGDKAIGLFSPEKVSKEVHRSTAKRTLSWGLVGTLFFIFTIPFAFAAWFDSYRANRQTKRALKKFSFHPAFLKPRDTARWFVYLDMSSRLKGHLAGSAKDLLIELSGVQAKDNPKPIHFALVIS